MTFTRFNIFHYALSALVLVTALTFHPFIFGIAVPDIWRYLGIALVSLAACLFAIQSRRDITESFFFAWIVFFACVSAVFSQYGLKFYFIYLSSILFLFSLLLFLKTNQDFRKTFEIVVLVTFSIYALYTISGFVYVNFLDGELLKDISIYGMFGASESEGGYVYDFNSFFGSFAKVGLGNTSLVRSVGITWEPNSTGILFMLGISVTMNSATLNSISKVLIVLLFGIAGMATISVTYLAILYVSIFFFAFGRFRTVGFRALIIICFLCSLALAFPKLQSTSLNIRIDNIKWLFDYIVTNFDIVDHLFGRGLSWNIFEMQPGIDAGYLYFYSQLGLMNTVALVVIWATAARANTVSMATMLLSPLALNLQMSLVYVIFVVLLLVDIEYAPAVRSKFGSPEG